jgi:hypothetical protein
MVVTPVIPALRRLRQEGFQFEASLDDIERPHLKRTKTKIQINKQKEISDHW